MAKTTASAGLLLFRHRAGELEVLLVHPGGPFWANKDEGAWTLPKGEVEPGEDDLAAALREFAEELGQPPPAGPYADLGEVRQKAGKRVHAFACAAGGFDPAIGRSNTFTVEWPPKSGRQATFPEVDRTEFFRLPVARRKINAAQIELLSRLSAASIEA